MLEITLIGIKPLALYVYTCSIYQYAVLTSQLHRVLRSSPLSSTVSCASHLSAPPCPALLTSQLHRVLRFSPLSSTVSCAPHLSAPTVSCAPHLSAPPCPALLTSQLHRVLRSSPLSSTVSCAVPNGFSQAQWYCPKSSLVRLATVSVRWCR